MVFLHHIGTRVPDSSYSQEFTADRMLAWLKDKKSRRYVESIYRDSGVEKRYSVISDFDGKSKNAFFSHNTDGTLQEPSTGARNAFYTREALSLGASLAKTTVEECPAIRAEDITHVITVSCTGFSNPGLDLRIVQELGLRSCTERYHLGFMGCYAAFPALRMACQFCQADSNAVVLVVCVELCTLHIQLNDELDSIVANSVFADGAAVAVVSAKTPAAQSNCFSLGPFSSELIPDGERDMAWTIGDRGFDIVLSKYVPRIIAANIEEIFEGILNKLQLAKEEIHLWAVHPGGKSILDKIEKGLGLSPMQIRASRQVLREYGNMSSATILFVLKEMLENFSGEEDQNVFSLAFGPGLTVESLFLKMERL